MFTVKQTNKQLQTVSLVVKGTQWYRVPSSTENDLIMARQVGWFIFCDVSYFGRDCKAHIMSGQRVRFFFFGVLVGMYSSWKVMAFLMIFLFMHMYFGHIQPRFSFLS